MLVLMSIENEAELLRSLDFNDTIKELALAIGSQNSNMNDDEWRNYCSSGDWRNCLSPDNNTGPPNGPVLFSSLWSVGVCRRL